MSSHFPENVSPAGWDVRELTDELRPQHPLVRNDRGEYVLLRHQDVKAAALDDETFSSAVSAFLQIPNGLDGEVHDRYRSALDEFLTPEAVAPYRQRFEQIAAHLVATLPTGVAVDAVDEVGAVFAVRAQSAWLGWSARYEQPLIDWVAQNHQATRSGDRDRMRQVAEAFDSLIRSIISERRGPGGEVIGEDLTCDLMRTRVEGQPLTDDEIVSVLRNWTGGDLGSIALCVGVILHYLATEAAIQDRLRSGVSDAEWDAIIDEILRIDDPFLTNRRITTCPVEIAGVRLEAGVRVKLNWTSANRDEAVFADPDAFDPFGNAAENLVYGIGRHVCPGRGLATMELRIATKALVGATTRIALAHDQPLNRQVHPVGGWEDLPVVFTRSH